MKKTTETRKSFKEVKNMIAELFESCIEKEDLSDLVTRIQVCKMSYLRKSNGKENPYYWFLAVPTYLFEKQEEDYDSDWWDRMAEKAVMKISGKSIKHSKDGKWIDVLTDFFNENKKVK